MIQPKKPKNNPRRVSADSGREMKKESQEKYRKTRKGKEAARRAQKKYDLENTEKRREQKRDYMRRKRAENPSYCKWK